ncbi:MAG: ATP-binding cassette domain-containing protein [Bacteroidales bacterium]|nr:ATP-binding cassette domain-containing protein [Bacteroidales bacterium]
MEAIIKYDDVTVCHQDNVILKNVSMEIMPGDFVYFIGKVGTGKSTFMKSMYCEADIVGGAAQVLDYDLTRLPLKRIPELRRKLGIVFQDFQLLTDRSVYRNLRFVLKSTGWKDPQLIEERIDDVLALVDMKAYKHKMPHELSGGEQQRMAIARAILNEPKLILADEPTGNLDEETGNEIITVLRQICKLGATIIMTTHKLSYLEDYPGRVFRFENNNIKEIRQ